MHDVCLLLTKYGYLLLEMRFGKADQSGEIGLQWSRLLNNMSDIPEVQVTGTWTIFRCRQHHHHHHHHHYHHYFQVLHWHWSAGWSPEQWEYFNWQQQQQPQQQQQQKGAALLRSTALKLTASQSAPSDPASGLKPTACPALDHVSDVFSWGLIVVELFAGRWL